MRTFDLKTITESSGTALARQAIRSPATGRDVDLRLLLQEAADQLCQVVDGNLEFVVKVSEQDDDIDKLLLLVNFVLASARRSLNDLNDAHLRIDEDLAAARKLQEKLLPQKLPPARRLRASAKCVPARVVGGDFFDFFSYKYSDKYVGLLADVSGKGASAALYAALTSGIVGSLVEAELSPRLMLQRLNRNLFLRAPEKHFVALTYSIWDDERLVLETCGSGLPEPLLCRNGTIERLPLHGVPLGLMPETDYETMRIQCEPGDTFLFYTDGVVDAVDKDGNEFGTDRLCELMFDACRNKTAQIVETVFEQVTAHCACEANLDDQTVVVMSVL